MKISFSINTNEIEGELSVGQIIAKYIKEDPTFKKVISYDLLESSYNIVDGILKVTIFTY